MHSKSIGGDILYDACLPGMAVGIVKHKHTQWTRRKSWMLQQLRLNTLFPPAGCTVYSTLVQQQHHAFQHELAAGHAEVLPVLLSLCLLQYWDSAGPV